MPSVDVYNIVHEKVGDLELDQTVFGSEVKEHLFYTVVRYQQAKSRSGNHKVKGRAEISGGGRKPFKQKGTGRARQGTSRAPQMRGGGVVFGPVVRDHSHKVSKKVRKAALRCALSRRVEENAFIVFDSFQFEAIRTRSFRNVMETFGFDELLLILPEKDEVVIRSARNLPGVRVLPVAGLNVYDILNHKNVAATQDAVAGITARLGK